MGLLDLQDCELDDEMEAPAAVEREQRRATIEEVVNDDDQEEFTRAGPTTRRAAVRAAKRNDRPPAPTPLEKILERTTGYQTTGSSKNAYAPDTHVLARCSANLGQWFGGTIVEGGEDGTCRVVFLDGAKEDVSINNIRVWDRPPLSDWHRKHQGPIKSRYVADVQSKANTHRSVLQFDLESGALIAQFVSARRAVDNVPSLTDPQEVLQCCKGAVESAGGYKWTFAAPRPKLDAADVQELIDGNYAIQIQQRNPKKAGTKSALLYDQYKGAESIRDMLALGARRADIPYDISHGWVTLVDPTLQKRFSPPPTAAAPEPPSKEAVEADDDDEGLIDDPMEEDSENDESREDVLKTLPPRPPPARARSRGAAVNYADPPDF